MARLAAGARSAAGVTDAAANGCKPEPPRCGEPTVRAFSELLDLWLEEALARHLLAANRRSPV
jgi:hypothetical protein